MFRRIFTKTLAYNARLSSTTAPGEKFDLKVGVLVERLPVISKELNEIEKEMMVSEKSEKSFSMRSNSRYLVLEYTIASGI